MQRRNSKGQFIKSSKRAVHKRKADPKKATRKSSEARTIKSVPKPAKGGVAVRLKNTHGKHNKEYYISQSGTKVTVIWGPIGGWKRSKTHSFKSVMEAQAWALRQAKIKYNRGYDV